MSQKEIPIELGTKNIRKLLMQYALPAIIAMTASSLYNIIDSVFIGHGVGPLAISALALSFPLMNLSAAFGTLIGVGAATLTSVRLGQKDYKTAKILLGNAVVMNVITGIGFTVIGLIFLNPILIFFGASSQTLHYAHDFMFVILLGNVFTHIYFGLNALLRSSGSPDKAMYATIGTVIINICLNPFFIFGLHLGIIGSALATVISQITMLSWEVYLLCNKNHYIHFQRGIYRLHKRIVIESLSIGMSPFLMNVAACLIVILINNGLKNFGGDLAIGAYGIVNRVSFVFIMIIMGFNQGMQPIAGYNYGAKLYPRVIQVLKITIYCATLVSLIGFLLCEIFPYAVSAAFTTDSELIRLSVQGLRITMVTMPIVGFYMVTTNFFQSIGKANKSIFLSLTRQVIFLIPGLLIWPVFYGLNGIWISIPFSDLLATITSLFMLLRQISQFKKIEHTVA